MRLTNLYNYDDVHTFSSKNHVNLDCVQVISNTGYDEEPQREFIQYGIYDSANENRVYLNLLKKFDLSDLTIEVLMGSYYSISDRRRIYSINKLECRRSQIDKTKHKS